MKGTFSNFKRGFTLVELVVVIAIIAILSGVGFAAYSGYVEYTQKGVDRATAGEVLNAFDLANYTDPELFSEGETAMFYFTDSGAKAFKGGGSAELTGYLEDALGSLGNLRLKYPGWNGTSVSKVKEILDSAQVQELLERDDTYLSKYLKLEGGKTASYAGEMSELWDVVEKKLEAFGSKTGSHDYLSKVINLSTDSNFSDQILSAWKSADASAGMFPMMLMKDYGNTYLGLQLARNYSFAAFVENNYSDRLTPAMKETLSGLKADKSTTNIQGYYNTCYGSEWTDIVNDYVTNQAETDALAFLGLMETGKAVMSGDSDTSDENLRGKMESVINAATDILNKSSSIEDYQAFINEMSTINADGKVVSFGVQKVNGNLVPTGFSDIGLNPRSAGTGE